MRQWKFVVTVEVQEEAYVGNVLTSVWPSNVAELIEAAIWKTYADPERKTAGILTVSSVVGHKEE